MFKQTYDTNKMLEQIKREDESNDWETEDGVGFY
jgi:hypothetical protein